jgi:hypothetical protein
MKFAAQRAATEIDDLNRGDAKRCLMKKISFLFYYAKLLLSVACGVHRTANPLGVKWRWNFWQSKYAAHRSRRHFG